jgi:tryptophan-rich sensory protein
MPYANSCPDEKSPYQPPGFAFGIAWGLLYILMGIAAVTYWRSTKDTTGIYAFLVLLFALQGWWLRFADSCGKTERNTSLAALLAIAVYAAWIASMFWKTSTIAGSCLVPLVLWLTFASFLQATTKV